jgi:hypothetical protein
MFVQKIFKLNSNKSFETARLLVVLVSIFDIGGGRAWQRMAYSD